MRTEISLKILKITTEKDKEIKLWDLLKIHSKEKTLIYIYRIEGHRGVKELAQKANEKGHKAVSFHGEMSSKERQGSKFILRLKTLDYFEDEDIKQCFTYFIDAGLIKIRCKGFSDFKAIEYTSSKEVNGFINASKTKNLITTVKNSEITVEDIVKTTYTCIVDNTAELSKPLDRKLVIDVMEEKISG